MNQVQKELLKNLTALWEKYPDQRFGQLLFNFTRIGTRMELGRVMDPFWYQDEEILEDIKHETGGIRKVQDVQKTRRLPKI